jgi:hypothetical protein
VWSNKSVTSDRHHARASGSASVRGRPRGRATPPCLYERRAGLLTAHAAKLLHSDDNDLVLAVHGDVLGPSLRARHTSSSLKCAFASRKSHGPGPAVRAFRAGFEGRTVLAGFEILGRGDHPHRSTESWGSTAVRRSPFGACQHPGDLLRNEPRTVLLDDVGGD